MQRFFDVLFSSLALILLSPLLIPIALLLRFTGEGEIFYVQKRVGRYGKDFGLLKFATMLKDSPNIGNGDITIKNDPRVLPMGKFLRKTKVNELPQLINIFKGDMSIVGPRPLIPKTFEQYGEDGKLISQVRPGLTGVGSIIFRDEERFLASQSDPVSFYFEVISPHKAQLELWYLQNQSVWLYFAIIFMTAWVVLFPNSKLHDSLLAGIPTMPESLLKAGEHSKDSIKDSSNYANTSKGTPIFGVLLVFVILFLSIGYLLSDNYFADEIIAKNKLNTPDDIFNYVIARKHQAPAGSPIVNGESFRQMVNRQGDWLWCDEGSIVVAVLSSRLGYKTRLVDLVNQNDGISHHTVLQIFQNSQWVTYDFTGRQYNVPLEKTVDYPPIAQIRTYPNWKQELLLTNYFLRLIAQVVKPWAGPQYQADMLARI